MPENHANKTDLRKLILLAMLSALAFVVMLFGRIPVILFLRYEAKDVIITLGGFLFGPWAAFVMSAVVALLELSVSDTGLIGALMNLISSAAFCVTASAIFHRKRSVVSAAVGTVVAAIFTALLMMPMNYLLTPIYMGVSRADVVALMLPALLPFNLLKGALNASLVILLFKPFMLLAQRSVGITLSPIRMERKGILPAILVAAGLLLAACVLFILSKQGIL